LKSILKKRFIKHWFSSRLINKNMRIKWTLFVAVIGLLVLSGIASANEHRADSFVCPVFNPDTPVGDKNPQAFQIGDIEGEENYSIKPGKAFTHPNGPVSVPDTATNAEGFGAPFGPHDVPGDDGYTAIWKTVPNE
jgi:hypothetical protein